MKIEKRGKYAGVKVHLDENECAQLLELTPESYEADNVSVKFVGKLGKKIRMLLLEEPNLLKPRTPDEIKHELEVELESATLKLKALHTGQDWKEIHLK